jgi:hypothetical protein
VSVLNYFSHASWIQAFVFIVIDPVHRGEQSCTTAFKFEQFSSQSSPVDHDWNEHDSDPRL